MSFNKVIIIGRLTADPELKMTQSGLAVTSFSVAVDRRFAKESDEIKADFFTVVCWRKTAEFVCNYFSKGKEILVEGELQNRSYTANDGRGRTVTEIVADRVQFSSAKKDNGAAVQNTPQQSENSGFTEVAEDDDLPF